MQRIAVCDFESMALKSGDSCRAEITLTKHGAQIFVCYRARIRIDWIDFMQFRPIVDAHHASLYSMEKASLWSEAKVANRCQGCANRVCRGRNPFRLIAHPHHHHRHRSLAEMTHWWRLHQKQSGSFRRKEKRKKRKKKSNRLFGGQPLQSEFKWKVSTLRQGLYATK